MAKKLLSKTLLLAALLLAGVSTAWADKYTIGWGTATGDNYKNFTATDGEVEGLLEFTTSKEGSGTNPAYNSSSNELRLYYNSTGNGGSITLTPVSGVTITKAVITTSTSPSVAYTVDEGTATSVSVSNNTYTISGIEASKSLKIQNVNTSNTQLRIKTIEIIYNTSAPSISFETSEATITAGKTYTQTATTFNADNAVVTYSSGNTSIATVDASTGMVTGIAEGQTTITASMTVDNKEYSASYTINVEAAVDEVSGLTINFETNDIRSYVDWTFTNLGIKTTTIDAHDGQYYGATINAEGNAVGRTLITTKEKVATPGIIKFYVSKESTNTNADSYWIVEVSTDGNNWTTVGDNQSAAVNITKGGWTEVTRDLSTHTNVYVQIRYNGSNAIRTIDDISISPAAPSITVSSDAVELGAEAAEGTLDLDYAKLDISDMTDFGVQFYDENEEEIEAPEWIEAVVATQDPQIGEGYVVSYVVDANDGEARTAHFKVLAMCDEDFVYSNLVTITQAEYVEPKDYALASSVTPGKKYIIVGVKNSIFYAMGVQNANNRAAVEVDEAESIITVKSSDVAEFTIEAAGNNYTFFDGDGYLYAESSERNYLKTEAELDDNGKWAITFSDEAVASIVAQGTSTRNVMQFNSSSSLFSCYSSASQSEVYLYEEVADEPETVAVAITDAGFATFCSAQALDFTATDDIEAYVATVDGETINFSQVKKVAAEMGVLLRSVSGAAVEVNVPVLGPNDQTDAVTGNALVGTLEEIASLPSTDANNGTNYILNDGANGIGFYKANGQKVGAGKAYLHVAGGQARTFIGFDSETAISTVESAEAAKNAIYNLSGQRVMQPTKGLYIVNGKKVVLK